MEYLNDSLNANDNNVSTNLYDLLGESNLADNFGNLCSDLDQQYQSNSTGTFSNETEVMYSGSNNDQNIILDSNLNDRTNSNTLVSNEWNLRIHDHSKNQRDSDFSEIFYMNSNDQTDNNCAISISSKALAHSDNDSDSGICSSSVSCNSGLSPKNMLNPVSIYDESSQMYSSTVSSVIDLDNRSHELVDQLINSNDIGLQHFNGFVLPNESANDNLDGLLINATDENANTEQLLDSIEQMLKSMEDPTEKKQICNNTNSNLTKPTPNSYKIIKNEPNEVTVNGASSKKFFTKIVPKLSPKPPGLTPKAVKPIGNIVRILQPNSINSPIIFQMNNHVLTTPNQSVNTILSENVNTGNSDGESSKNKKIKSDAYKDEPAEKKFSLKNATLEFSSNICSLPNNLLNKTPEKMSSCDSSNQQYANLDPSLAKKQSRMIKNRESACLSRKRKKEYVQTLEESIEVEKKKFEILRAENLTLKDRILVLETENKLLREQHNFHVEQDCSSSIKALELKKQKTVDLNSNITNSGTLKRPFIMMAVFLVFGLNIFQFINVNINNSPDLTNNSKDLIQHQQLNNLFGPKKLEYTPSQLAAALSKSDGALIDLQSPLQSHVKSRHLLSEDYENFDELEIFREKQKLEKNTVSHVKENLTRSKNESNMELVFINGTWHMVDLNICYKIMSLNATENESRFYNHSHFNKVNSELSMWFEQHVKIMKSSQNKKDSNQNFASALWTEFMKEKQKKNRLYQTKNQPSRLRSLQTKRHLRAIESINGDFESVHDKEIYPISLYDTQSRLYENFARTVRTRDDTLYYVSFRRDHVIFPAINQSKNRRPKLSLIVPSMFNIKKPLNESSDSTSKENDKKIFQFIQIDCEVLDTKLFHLNSDDIPHDYRKILSMEDIPNGFNY